MRKWTYLVAALLSAGVTVGTFSSCIDNDEPEGINILRKAKAELIAAKKALVEAQAEKTKADAQAALIKAECEKAAAEIEKLQAEAELENEKAEAEARIAAIQAELNIKLQEAELTLETLKLKYETAWTEFEKAKLELSAGQADFIETWYNKYYAAQEAYNSMYDTYVQAQREYAEALLDPDARDFERELKLKNDVEKAQMTLDWANAEVARLEKEIEEAKGMEPSELGQKYAALVQERKENREAYTKIDIEKAEAVREADLQTKLDAAKDAYNAALNTEIEIAEFKYQFPELGIPGLAGEFKIEKAAFSVDENGNEINGGDLNFALNRLNSTKEYIDKLFLDEDDKAWTQAYANELKLALPGYEKAYTDNLVGWNLAVKAYNNGNGTTVANFTKYAAVNEKVTEFNKLIPGLNTAKKAYYDALAAVDQAEKALGDAKTLTEIRTETEKEITDTYNANCKSERETMDATLTRLQNAENLAQAAYDDADARATAAEELVNTLGAAATKTERDRATTLRRTADQKWTALNTAKAANASDDPTSAAYKAVETYNQNTARYLYTYTSDMAAAQKAYEDGLVEYAGSQKDPALVAAVTKANETVTSTEKALDDLIAAAKKVFDEQVVKANNALVKEINTFKGADLTDWVGYFCENKLYDYENEFNSIKSDKDKEYSTIGATVTMSNDDARNLIVCWSRTLFGQYYSETQYDDSYNVPGMSQGHLVALDKDEVIALIKKYYQQSDLGYEELPEYMIPELYNRFGLLGSWLEKSYELDKVNAYLNNGEAITAAITSFDEEIKKLNDSKDAQVAVVKKAREAYDSVIKEFNEFETPFRNKMSALDHELNMIDDIIEAVVKAAYTLDETNGYIWNSQDGYFPIESLEQTFTQENIDKYIENLQNQVDAYVKGSVTGTGENQVTLPTIKELEDRLEAAKIKLAAWENGELSGADAAKFAVEEAEYDLNLAKEKVDYYKKILDTIIAGLEAAE